MSTADVNQQIPAGTWTVDPVHSSIHFAVTHNGVATFRSGFDALRGALSGGEEPQLEGTVEVASIDIDEEQLKGHLLSPEFFDAERYPQLRFSSTELERRRGRQPSGSRRARDPRRDPRGRGQRPLRPARRRPRRQAPASASRSRPTVDRRDFGLDWNAELPSGGEVLEYEVAIAVELELVAGGRVTMRVLGISGSLRRDSLNSALLRAAAERLPAGVELVEFERLRGDPALRRRRRSGAGRRRRSRSCARRCARPTRS